MDWIRKIRHVNFVTYWWHELHILKIQRDNDSLNENVLLIIGPFNALKKNHIKAL